MRFRTYGRPLTAAVFTSLLLVACSDDDDDNVTPPPAGATAFTTVLDGAQAVPAPIAGTRVRVVVTNRAPDLGTFQTPVWVGFHNGSFDIYDIGASAASLFPMTNALERLAEDGSQAEINEAFDTMGFGTTQGAVVGVLGGGPIQPGETVSAIFELDSALGANAYFSYAAMVLPSNDAFIANGDPLAHPIFDGVGNFVGSNFTVTGAEALDAGTEVNDEEPANTAFFGQMNPDTGTPEALNVALHAGYDPAGNILAAPEFANADFLAAGYEFLEIRFEELGAGPAATGAASIDVISAQTQVQVDLAAAGLSGPATRVGINDAAAGATGVELLDLTDSIQLNSGGRLEVVGTTALASAPGLLDALRAGDAYLNVATALNPDGELRGQVSDGEAFVGALNTVQEIPAPVAGTPVRVTVRNRAPEGGTFLTPLWIGTHDGGFDIYDIDSPASTYFPVSDALERFAEDGDFAPLQADFTTQGFGARQSLLTGQLAPQGAGPIPPGETITHVFAFDGSDTQNAYISYGAMVLPSNDTFIANGDPQAHQIFDGAGVFQPQSFTVTGAEALDAGTEVNDENPDNTAFFGQLAPDMGTVEGANVTLATGFNVGGNILSDPAFPNADYTVPGYEFLSVDVTAETPGPLATGSVTVSLNEAETEITYSITASDLSGDVVGTHLHEAAADATGPIVLDLTSQIITNEGGNLSVSGVQTVDAAFVTALRAGEIYANVHTVLNPMGEIRAQLSLNE